MATIAPPATHAGAVQIKAIQLKIRIEGEKRPVRGPIG
jgi:hypothetical protein